MLSLFEFKALLLHGILNICKVTFVAKLFVNTFLLRCTLKDILLLAWQSLEDKAWLPIEEASHSSFDKAILPSTDETKEANKDFPKFL